MLFFLRNTTGLYSKLKWKTFFTSTPEFKNEKQKQLFRCMNVCMQMHVSFFLLTKDKSKPEAHIPICYNKIYKYLTIYGAADKKEKSLKLITAAESFKQQRTWKKAVLFFMASKIQWKRKQVQVLPLSQQLGKKTLPMFQVLQPTWNMQQNPRKISW